jgi:hypothetical protein
LFIFGIMVVEGSPPSLRCVFMCGRAFNIE